MSQITGLVSGLDTASIIQQLVDVERSTQNIVAARGNKAKTALSAYDALRGQMSALQSSSQSLGRSIDWQVLAATSSNKDAVSLSAGTGTFGGTLSFNVDRLAAAGSVRSTNVLTSTATAVANDLGVFVAAGGRKIGFDTFASNDALSIGSHEVKVTQSSAAATKSGTTALGVSTVIDGTNDQLQLSVNGSPFVATLAHGTYTRTQLAAAVQAAAASAGAPVNVGVDAVTNTLTVASTREGSAATLRITGGNSLGALGLTVDGANRVGTDGKVSIDGGADQTFTSIDAGGSAVLNASAGAITATFSGGLRAGAVTGKNVSVGDGSLGTVVGAINAANAGVTATAVQVGDNAFRLQITSNATGAEHGSNVASSEFSAAVGGFLSLSDAADAQITVGTGPGAYTVTSATNVISGLMPGVTATLKSTTTTPLTISVARDAQGLADKVQAMVDSANKLHKAIVAATKYDPDNKLASPLTGDSTTARLSSQLNNALTSAVPWATPGAPGLVGVSVDKTGAFTFDSSKFVEAFNTNPEGVMRAFTAGGTATDPSVTFTSAGNQVRAGTYAVNITQAATQAAATGLTGVWPIGAPPTVKVRIGTTEASYVVKATDGQADVVAGLNAAIANAGLGLQASVSGTGIKVNSTAYGHAATFDVAWDGTTFTTQSGLDVAGTINGVAGTGTGRQLIIPFTDRTLGGLALDIAATSAGALGTFTYEPGVAQRVTGAMVDASDSVTGYITSSENALKARVTFVDRQVASMEQRVVKYQARLRLQFANLETVLSRMKSQSEWLSGQVAGLNATLGG